MKPHILENLPYKDPEGLKLLRYLANEQGHGKIDRLYDLYSFEKETKIGIVDPLETVSINGGFRPRQSKRIGKGELFPVAGSAGWHEDPGHGLVLSTLMLVSSKTVGAIQLITSHGGLTLREGDFFVFDANRGHAWVSNARCVIAQIPVSKFYNKAIEAP